MMLFHTDLDNTLIYYYKHDIGKEKRCIEIYHNREITFITAETYRLLRELKEKMLIVPTTTRTVEQYERIDFGMEKFRYALVCNGGVLLENGEENRDWYRKSRNLVQECQEELEKSRYLLQNDPDRSFEVRNIQDLFVFTKSENPESTVEMLKENLNTEILDIFRNRIKVYVVPKQLSKGKAVQRFKEFIGADTVISAGDSEFDVSMLNVSDIAIAPEQLRNHPELNAETVFFYDNSKRVFSESVLQQVIALQKQGFLK